MKKTINDLIVTEVVDQGYLLGVGEYNNGSEVEIPKELALHIVRLQKGETADADFEEIARPVIAFMNTVHPHHMMVVTSTGAELLEGQKSFTTKDYIKD